MSTRINVTVGDGGLLDRNAQQTAANRQARVLADQRATAETQGVERRTVDRTTAGLDPLTGLPAATPSSSSAASFSSGIRRLDQEPAATRRQQQGTAYVLYFPNENILDAPVLGIPDTFASFHIGKAVKLPNKFTNIYENLFPTYGRINGITNLDLTDFGIGVVTLDRATLSFIQAGGPFNEPAVSVRYTSAVFNGVTDPVSLTAAGVSSEREFIVQENVDKGVTIEADHKIVRTANYGIRQSFAVTRVESAPVALFAAQMTINITYTSGIFNGTVTFRNNVSINFPYVEKFLSQEWFRLGCTITPDAVFYFFDGQLLYTEPIASEPSQKFFVFSGTAQGFDIGLPEITEDPEVYEKLNTASQQTSCTRLFTKPLYTSNYTPKSLLVRP